MEKIKDKRRMDICICKNCGKEFQKPLSEIKRNENLNRPNFCSRTCVGKNNVKNFGNKRGVIIKGSKSAKRGDEFTKFRYHFRSVLRRNKEIDITINDLKDQWETQNGVCPYSGVKLILSSYCKIKKNPIYAASLDRIDSHKGYVKGNIVWISKAMNWMKNDMTEEMVYELCNIIADNVNKKRGLFLTTP